MVNTLTKKGLAERLAFTLIELIFAIVIIGVSMLTLPMVMQIDASNQEDALMQEGIMLTTTKVAQTLTYQWDPQSSPGGANLMSLSQSLDTGGSAFLRRVAGTDFRVGHIQEQLRRRMTPASATRNASAIGAGANSISTAWPVENIGGANQAFSYKKQWTLTTSVLYVDDAAAFDGNPINFDFNTTNTGTTTSIKMVRVTAIDNTPGADGNQVVLTSFSSNIGEAEFYQRRY